MLCSIFICTVCILRCSRSLVYVSLLFTRVSVLCSSTSIVHRCMFRYVQCVVTCSSSSKILQVIYSKPRVNDFSYTAESSSCLYRIMSSSRPKSTLVDGGLLSEGFSSCSAALLCGLSMKNLWSQEKTPCSYRRQCRWGWCEGGAAIGVQSPMPKGGLWRSWRRWTR